MNQETIKFFSESELKIFFKVLEKRVTDAKTDFALATAIRNEALFKIEYYCALRISETLMLKKSYFNPLKNELYCNRIKGGLSNTLRIIDADITNSLKKHIEKNKPKDYLFVNFHTQKPLSRKTVDVIFKKVCQDANKFYNANIAVDARGKDHNHTLRHTRGIYLADHECDIKEIQYWLGHKNITNTMIYLQFTTRQQNTLYKRLEKSQKKERERKKI